MPFILSVSYVWLSDVTVLFSLLLKPTLPILYWLYHKLRKWSCTKWLNDKMCIVYILQHFWYMYNLLSDNFTYRPNGSEFYFEYRMPEYYIF